MSLNGLNTGSQAINQQLRFLPELKLLLCSNTNVREQVILFSKIEIWQMQNQTLELRLGLHDQLFPKKGIYTGLKCRSFGTSLRLKVTFQY